MTEREKLEYELALRVGKKRFGSQCEHVHTKGKICANCLRKTVTSINNRR